MHPRTFTISSSSIGSEICNGTQEREKEGCYLGVDMLPMQCQRDDASPRKLFGMRSTSLRILRGQKANQMSRYTSKAIRSSHTEYHRKGNQDQTWLGAVMALAEHMRWIWGLLKSCGEETKVVEDGTPLRITHGPKFQGTTPRPSQLYYWTSCWNTMPSRRLIVCPITPTNFPLEAKHYQSTSGLIATANFSFKSLLLHVGGFLTGKLEYTCIRIIIIDNGWLHSFRYPVVCLLM